MEPSLSKNAVAAVLVPTSPASIWSQIDLRQIIAPSATQFRGTQIFSLLLTVVMAVCLVSELLTLVTFFSRYYCTFNTFYLERRVCGFDTMMAAFVVALAELYPKRAVLPRSAADGSLFKFCISELFVGSPIAGAQNEKQLALTQV